MKSFSLGGIHPPEYKISRTEAIQDMPLPESVVLPLGQHIGAPATPCVKKGDRVLVGQVIGTPNGFVSAYIHSSVSGTVTAVDGQPDIGGGSPTIGHDKGRRRRMARHD